MHFDQKEIATFICRATGRSDFKTIHNQIRVLTSKRLITAGDWSEVYGPRGALLFQADSIYRAQLLITLVDLGFEGRALEAVNASACANRAVQTEAGGFEFNLATVIETYLGKKEEPSDIFRLEITGSRIAGDGSEVSQNQELEFHAQWVMNGNRFGRPDPTAESSFVIGRVIEAVVTIPVHNLFEPIRATLADKIG